MATLTELDVINDMLSTLGEAPLNALDDDHAMVAAGRLTLRRVSSREQAKKWWFNTEIATLTPDPENGSIYIPADALSVDPVQPSNEFVVRGRRLYNPNTGSYAFTKEVECRIIRKVEFDDLPETAAAFIAATAVRDFCRAYDGDKNKMDALDRERREAYITLNSEHIRNSNTNLLRKPSTAALANALGWSPGLGGLYN